MGTFQVNMWALTRMTSESSKVRSLFLVLASRNIKSHLKRCGIFHEKNSKFSAVGLSFMFTLPAFFSRKTMNTETIETKPSKTTDILEQIDEDLARAKYEEIVEQVLTLLDLDENNFEVG